MKNTFFMGKDNNISSQRSHENGIEFTSYTSGANTGGVTFHSDSLTSRFSQSGRFMGSGFKSSGNFSMYVNSSARITDRLTEFK